LNLHSFITFYFLLCFRSICSTWQGIIGVLARYDRNAGQNTQQ